MATCKCGNVAGYDRQCCKCRDKQRKQQLNKSAKIPDGKPYPWQHSTDAEIIG